ncbi:MAG: ArnT family glycosyltransferase [Pyrinomonadaceae bacterium]
MRTTIICVVIFLVALVVRGFHWQDNPIPPFHGMTGEYKAHALELVNGDLKGFLRGPNPPSDANVVKHPPGYPFMMAAVYKIFGDSDHALQSVHILLDAVAALLVILLAYEMFSTVVATIAGLLVAISPQLAYHSIALLPDPVATVPLLLSAHFFWRAHKNHRLGYSVAAGVCVGISCWFRSNALLLPLFLAVIVPLLLERGNRLRHIVALVGGAIASILPVTIRNYLAFKTLIPLSLSAGITLVVGIGLFDKEHKFGLPATDIGVTQWEAHLYNRPDYLCGRFVPDGVLRERRRIARGLDVIRAHPFWFLSVMAHRATDMMRLARVELIAAEPATSHLLDVRNARPLRSLTPAEIYQGPSTASELSLVNINALQKAELPAVDCGPYHSPMEFQLSEWNSSAGIVREQALRFSGKASTTLWTSPPLAVNRGNDYLLRLPLRIQKGSIFVEIVDASSGTVLATTHIVHAVNWAELSAEQQPFRTVEKPFAAMDADQVVTVVKNGDRRPAELVADAGNLEIFALGPSAHVWTRYPRAVIRFTQKLFLTAVFLPLIFIGSTALIISRRWPALALLWVVPVYYMCVQSALWTEFRYTLPMYYFLFIQVALGISIAAQTLWRFLRPLAAQWQVSKTG